MTDTPRSADTLRSTEVDLAVERLRAGGVVAIPTETVYGLAAVADDLGAIARVYELKGRPTSHPLIVHVADIERAEGWAVLSDASAALLADACWPGPLTLLVPRGRRVPDAVTGGRPTVGIRVPAHPLSTSLLERLGGALVAPSANRYGRVSPTTADHVLDDLGEVLDPARDLVLDGGPCPVGVESTIVDCTVDPPQVLRPGGIPTEHVERLLGAPLAPSSGPSRAAGMTVSHYAPACRVVPVDDHASAVREVERYRIAGRAVDLLDRTGDLVEAARMLYTDLREADRRGLDVLVVVRPAAEGLGHALRDRLSKAAADGGADGPDLSRGPTSPGG